MLDRRICFLIFSVHCSTSINSRASRSVVFSYHYSWYTVILKKEWRKEYETFLWYVQPNSAFCFRIQHQAALMWFQAYRTNQKQDKTTESGNHGGRVGVLEYTATSGVSSVTPATLLSVSSTTHTEQWHAITRLKTVLYTVLSSTYCTVRHHNVPRLIIILSAKWSPCGSRMSRKRP